MIFITGKKMRLHNGQILIDCHSVPEGISALLIVNSNKMTISREQEIWQANRLKLERVKI